MEDSGELGGEGPQELREGKLEAQALCVEHEGDEYYLLLAFLWKTITWILGPPSPDPLPTIFLPASGCHSNTASENF